MNEISQDFTDVKREEVKFRPDYRDYLLALLLIGFVFLGWKIYSLNKSVNFATNGLIEVVNFINSAIQAQPK